MSLDDVKMVALVAAVLWMLVGIPCGVVIWMRIMRRLWCLVRFRERRVRASTPEVAARTPEEEVESRALARDMAYFAVCVVPPLLLAVAAGKL